MTKPHLLHHFIWNSLMLAPLLAVIGSLLGYFYTSRILLRQLELSLLMGWAACSSIIWRTAGC